jgi:hypothetical protein
MRKWLVGMIACLLLATSGGSAVAEVAAAGDSPSDYSTFTIAELLDYLGWAIEFYNWDVEDIPAYDGIIAGLTNGMIGGDMPMVWDKYPEDMTDAEWAAFVQLVTDNWGSWPTSIGLSLEDYLDLLWWRRFIGGDLEDMDFEDLGFTWAEVRNQTTDALNDLLRYFVTESNEAMNDMMYREKQIAAILEELLRRGIGAIPGIGALPQIGPAG